MNSCDLCPAADLRAEIDHLRAELDEAIRDKREYLGDLTAAEARLAAVIELCDDYASAPLNYITKQIRAAATEEEAG